MGWDAGGRAFVPNRAPIPCFCFTTCHILTTCIFNNILAIYSYLLCFHQHSRLAPGCRTPLLCFHRHSRVAPSLFESYCSFLPLRGADDILSWAVVQAKHPASPNSAQTPKAGGSPRRQERREELTIHHSQTELRQPEPPVIWCLNPESCFFHNPAYHSSLSSPACQEAKCPGGTGAPTACPPFAWDPCEEPQTLKNRLEIVAAHKTCRAGTYT